MIEHMVWIKFREGVSEDRRQTHLQALSDLRNAVPGVTALTVGENFTDRAKGFTHGLLVRFETKEDLKRYAEHPAHVPVAKALREDAELMAMDIQG